MTDQGSARGEDIAALILALQANVPAAMRERKQWLLWRFELYDGDTKPRKVPYWVSGRKRKGVQGGKDDREELASFDVCTTHLARGRYDGAGFAFLPGDGLIGIDIDGQISDEGEVSDRCMAIIQACSSYTELSPSGKGVHIICAGETKTFRDNSIGLEVFCNAQFFTVTGNRWGSAPEQVQPLAEGTLKRLQATVRAAKTKDKPPATKVRASAQPDKGASDFERINAAALSLLGDWVPALFPTARYYEATGAWRITSRDLGRKLQEDLSLHPNGINDYGEERGLTPIDVVVKFGGRTPGEALRWLSSAIGMKLRATAGKPGRAAAEGAQTPSAGSANGGNEPPGDDPPPEGSPEPPPWQRRLLRTGEGGLKDCRENVFTLLTHHPTLKGLVGYDEFAHVVKKLRVPPWGGEVGEWSQNDDYLLGYWLAQQPPLRLVVKAEATLVAGVAMAAFEAKFNPLLDYLNGLRAWDGIERLPFWLSECLGATDDEYTRLVGTWFIMGMVKRALDPGCQMDYTVVLEGRQGKKKSSALRTLVGRDEWFADTPFRLGDKDSLLSLPGKWLYEIAELDSFNKAEVTAVKGFVTSRVDRVREPFARRPVDRRRTCVFGCSTNQSEYFKDPTGARRFWPVGCDGEIDLAKLAEWRDMLYAEALHRLRSEDVDVRRYYPTLEETERLLVPQQEKREIVDPWSEKLAMWLESKAVYGDSGLEVREVESFTSIELLTRCLNVPMDRIDGGRQMATRVGIAMSRLGWEKRRDATGARVWRYWRPKPAKAESGTTGGPVGDAGLDEAETLHEF